jgi:DNA-binding CsgD family transcriptional regulator
MVRVRLSDLQATTRFVVGASAMHGSGLLSVSSLAGLAELIPSDLVASFEIRVADGRILGITEAWGPEEVPGTREALAEFGEQNPLLWRTWTPAAGALRLSAVIKRRDLERTGFHAAYMRPNRIRDTLKIWLAISSYSVACVSLDRFDLDFTQREAAILEILQPHLTALRAAARAADAPGIEDVELSPTESKVLSWVVRGKRDEEIAQLLFIAPATIRKHLEHAYAKLAVHSRAEAMAKLVAAPREARDATVPADELISGPNA